MREFPQGHITLVFTDIEGSSALWEEHGEAFSPVLQEHNRLMREAAGRHEGVEVKTEGDAFFLVFARGASAVAFALEAQKALHTTAWPTFLGPLQELRVRMGMHSGSPIFARHPDGQVDYFGPVVNRAARVGAAGYGGQVVVSEAVYQECLGRSEPPVQWEDLGRHRLKGVGEERLWQVSAPGLPNRFPPLKTLAGARHNLPAGGTPFIGRSAEIAGSVHLLQEPLNRLVTLLGFGGQGKTRLAQQVAEQVVEEFADGVWWVELEEARDAESMLGRIAHELRIPLSPQTGLQQQVQEFLRERELLLVLDNTEQIAAAGTVISTLLSAASRLKCLVTSRRALEIRGEKRVQVPPLPAAECLELFATVARSRREDFELDADTESAVLDLCKSLENVPLAIELAASRVGMLSPQQMLSRLDERFKLLQSRSPDLPPRQRALRGAIDWSYDLLETADQDLLATLSVFRGGFLLEDLEAIETECEVWEGVEALLSHSLVRTETEKGALRFLLQESVRVYAAEKLALGNRGPALIRKHAEHYVAVAEGLSAGLHGPAEKDALQRAAAERANIGMALQTSLECLEADLAARAAIALYDLIHPAGLWEVAGQGLVLVERAGLFPGQPWPGRLALREASLAHDRGEGEVATERALQARSLAMECRDTATVAAAQNLLGLLSLEAGRFDEAEENLKAGQEARGPWDHHGMALAWHNLGFVASRQGNAEGAASWYQKALQERRQGGDKRGEAETLGNLGALEHRQGHTENARSHYLQSLNLRQELGDRLGVALMLHNLAELAEEKGAWQKAIVFYTHAGQIFSQLGSAFSGAPREALSRLESRLGPEFAPLAERALQEDWAAWKEE